MYEITFITKNEKDPAVKKTIESLAGKITANSSLGRRKLAYPIKKETAGFYGTLVFDLDQGKIEELNKKMRLDEQVLRYLIIEKRIRVVKKKIAKPKKETFVPTLAKEEKEIEAVQEKKPIEKVMPEKEIKKEISPKIEKKIKKPMPRHDIGTGPAPKALREVQVTEEERLKALEDKLSELLKE